MIVILFNVKINQWEVVGYGYPYLSFDIKNTHYYIICYDKFSDKIFCKINLNSQKNS